MKALFCAGILMVAIAGTASAQKPTAKPAASADEQRPPKGMCRIWLKDVPAAQQPAPTDCASAVKNCPPTAKVIFGDTRETKKAPTVDPKTEAKLEPKAFGGSKKPLVTRKPPFVPPVAMR